jgi:pimeloyl-ACP methyl ester carboxylesterase
MTPVVFIHGFGGRASEFLQLDKYLKTKGYNTRSYSYKEKNGSKSITELATELDTFLADIPGRVDIVAHSMGGIIAEQYILKHPDKVRKLVTVCTPYNGTLLAHLLPLLAARDLRPQE